MCVYVFVETAFVNCNLPTNQWVPHVHNIAIKCMFLKMCVGEKTETNNKIVKRDRSSLGPSFPRSLSLSLSLPRLKLKRLFVNKREKQKKSHSIRSVFLYICCLLNAHIFFSWPFPMYMYIYWHSYILTCYSKRSLFFFSFLVNIFIFTHNSLRCFPAACVCAVSDAHNQMKEDNFLFWGFYCVCFNV